MNPSNTLYIGLTNMKLSTLATLTLIGLGYVYTIRLVGTFHHGLFRTALVAGPVVGLNILAGLVQFLFFVTLRRRFVPREKPFLRFAAGLAIIGSAVAALFYGSMEAGALGLEWDAGVPRQLIDIVIGLIIFFMAAEGMWEFVKRIKWVTAPEAERRTTQELEV